MQEKETDKPTNKPKKKTPFIKKILKGVFYVLIGFIILNTLLYVLLSVPFIQQKALQFAVGQIKDIVKTEVKIDEIRLSLFNNVRLKGVYIEDQSQDTLVYANNLEVSISPLKLLQNKLIINEVSLDDFTVNISKLDTASNFNFQFLIDAFAADSTSSDSSGNSMTIDIQDITLKKGRVKYDILSDSITPNEFNPSHIHIYDLNSNLQLPSLDFTNFSGVINSFSFNEYSGLKVLNLKANITSRNTVFYVKDIELDLPQSSLRIPSAEYNLLTGRFNLTSNQSTLSPSDIYPFMKDLKYLKEDIVFETSLSGKLPEINLDTLSIQYGKTASLKASAAISDYSRLDQTSLKLVIGSLQIGPEAINDFARIGDSTFVNPQPLNTLGTIRMEGNLDGTLSELNLSADAWAKQGALRLIADASMDTTFENFTANIKLLTQNFNLGALLEMPELGRISGNINVAASQNSHLPLKADLRGELINIQYNRIDYSNIPFTGYYNSEKFGGWLSANLPQGKIEAKIDMTQDNNPKIDLDVNVQKLKIDAFYPIEGWHNSELSTNMKGYFRGTDLKNIQANLLIDSLRFSHDSLSYATNNIVLEAGVSDSSKNYINLNSPLFKANISGVYDFMTLSDELINMMSNYLPGLFKKETRAKAGKNNFNVYLSVQNSEKLSKVLDLPFEIIEPLILKGTINTTDRKFDLNANLPLLRASGLGIQNTTLSLANDDTDMNMSGKTNVMLESGNMYLNMNMIATSDTINTVFDIKQNNTELDINAQLKARGHFEFNKKGELVSDVQFSPSILSVGKLDMTFMPAHIMNEGLRTIISNFGFMVGKGRMANRYFGIDGVISDQKQDSLNISFFNSDLGYILKAFDINNISTTVDGDVKIAGILGNPELYTENFKLSDIIIFNDTLGTLSLTSEWREAVGAIQLNANLKRDDSLQKSTIAGWVYPEQDSLNLKINVDRLSINWLQPFMSDMLNKATGSISTGLTATGKIMAPAIQGWLGVNDTYLGIDYTNVTYHISDTIKITPDKIGFDNLIVEDPNKNRAKVNALLTHKDFNDMQYSLDANLNNFMVLNTAGRIDSLFYGRVFANGTIKVMGNENQINMDMNLRNGKNSTLNVQIPQTADAGVYQSIVYINTPVEENKKTQVSDIEKPLPLKLNVNLTVTPDLTLGVIINPLTGDNMIAKGSGLIKFSYDMQSEAMNAFGDYTLSEGSVRLKLQNIYNISLNIKEGSKLRFNGDPLNTSFDIKAYKRVRADLRTLDSSFGSDQSNSPMVQAEPLLGISGNINKMDLVYDVTIPEASDDVQQRFRTILSTQNQRTQQFAYLLVMNSFYGGAGGNIAGGMLTSVAGSALSGALNAVLGKAIGSDWQIGTNFESDDGSFNNIDMTVSLSRKFLDNKLEFNTNLGYRTNQTSNDQFIGDFDLAYALTRSIKLKVFNKTNDRYYRQAEMTQGVGIVYTREAKAIKDLFRFYRKKRNNSNSQQTSSSR